MNARFDGVLEWRVRALLAAMQERIVTSSTYFGVPTQKGPIDVWVYQELITEIRPDVIVEIGNFHGGSLLAWGTFAT